MPQAVVLVLAACGTALATGLGAIPVFLLGRRAALLTPLLLGFAAGVMGVAAVAGLTIPALQEGSVATVVAGLAIGLGLPPLRPPPLRCRRRLHGSKRAGGTHLRPWSSSSSSSTACRRASRSGTAFASDREGLSLFVILAIAIQNIPEGTSVAIPMEEAGFSRTRQFWAAVGTSAPQPVGALLAFVAVEQVSGLLPFSFAFAAGAMLALIALEMLPKAYSGPGRLGPSAGFACGAGLMLALSALLGV